MNDMSTDTNQTDVTATVANLGQKAKAAAQQLALATADQRNLALNEAAKELRARTDAILAANAKDLDGVSG
jgi:glutamate-5-semialdehyde dehydrogenase